MGYSVGVVSTKSVSNRSFSFTSNGVDETEVASARLGNCMGPAGCLICLDGPLGAGKTAFVRGLARGLGLDVAQVASPTFVIANEYRLAADGKEEGRCLIHADLYRVENEERLWATGFEDYLRAGRVVVVEWANRFPTVLPSEQLHIQLDRPAGAEGLEVRHLVVEADGDNAQHVLEQWRERLSEGMS
jgi:tRNA threonylcarbamoyladenosine biosynthesis protein TsaE